MLISLSKALSGVYADQSVIWSVDFEQVSIMPLQQTVKYFSVRVLLYFSFDF